MKPTKKDGSDEPGGVMVAVFMAQHVLDTLGVFYLCSVVWKVARGYGFLRAFW
jgi:hypothetical protein